MSNTKIKNFKRGVFLVSGEDIRKLSTGTMKPEEAAKLESLAVVVWTGVDIMNMLKPDSEFMCSRDTMPQDLDVEALITNIIDNSEFQQWIIEEIYSCVHAELDELERQEAESDKA